MNTTERESKPPCTSFQCWKCGSANKLLLCIGLFNSRRHYSSFFYIAIYTNFHTLENVCGLTAKESPLKLARWTICHTSVKWLWLLPTRHARVCMCVCGRVPMAEEMMHRRSAHTKVQDESISSSACPGSNTPSPSNISIATSCQSGLQARSYDQRATLSIGYIATNY